MKQQSKKTDFPELKVTVYYTGKGNTCVVSIKEVGSLGLAQIVSPTEMFGAGDCFGDALADYTAQLDKYLERLRQFRNQVLKSERAYREAVHVDFAVSPLKEIEALKAFKAYFDDMHGKNLELFDNFYESANNANRVHCKDCDYLNMDDGKPYCCHSRMSTNGLDDWCDNGRRKRMSNILFRGKRKDNGEWVYGAYGSHTSLDAMIIDRPYPTSNGDLSALNFWTVNPATVGQYTGLTDKNGTKIFEGDIVEAYKFGEDKFVNIITFKNGCFWYGNWNFIEFLDKFRMYKVISNVHDGGFDNGKSSE